MTTRSSMPSTAFDPFGEPIDSVGQCTGEPRRRGSRWGAVVVFWTLALVLLTSRIYLGNQTFDQAAIVSEPTLTIAQAVPLR